MTMVEPACVMAKTAPSSTAGVPVCGMAATTCSWPGAASATPEVASASVMDAAKVRQNMQQTPKTAPGSWRDTTVLGQSLRPARALWLGPSRQAIAVI